MNSHRLHSIVLAACVAMISTLLLCLPASAQRLNADGLKMVSKVSIDNNKVIELKYDAENKLKEVVHIYKETNAPFHTYKEVITKVGNRLTQQSFLDGKLFNNHNDGIMNFFTYEYFLNEDGKIRKFSISDHSWAGSTYKREIEVDYKDGLPYCVRSPHTYTEFGTLYHVEQNVNILYTDEGYFTQVVEYTLTDELYKRYAPVITEDELKESLKYGGKLFDLDPSYPRYDYSSDIPNDTNIGFNGIDLMGKMGVSSHSNLDNILFYTEWVGLRERNMLKDVDRHRKRIVYQYDDKGNIVQIKYRYGEYYRKNRVDMEEDLKVISIEYVPE